MSSIENQFVGQVFKYGDLAFSVEEKPKENRFGIEEKTHRAVFDDKGGSVRISSEKPFLAALFWSEVEVLDNKGEKKVVWLNDRSANNYMNSLLKEDVITKEERDDLKNMSMTDKMKWIPELVEWQAFKVIFPKEDGVKRTEIKQAKFNNMEFVETENFIYRVQYNKETKKLERMEKKEKDNMAARLVGGEEHKYILELVDEILVQSDTEKSKELTKYDIQLFQRSLPDLSTDLKITRTQVVDKFYQNWEK